MIFLSELPLMLALKDFRRSNRKELGWTRWLQTRDASLNYVVKI